MRKSILFSDGCDILIYDSQGHLISEHNDMPRDLVVSVLNKLNSPEGKIKSNIKVLSKN